MANRAYLAKKERELKERIAGEDRKQRDVESKRKMATDIISSVSRIGSKIVPGINNDAKWYNKWVVAGLAADIPTFSNDAGNVASSPEVALSGPWGGTGRPTGGLTRIKDKSKPLQMVINWIPTLGWTGQFDGSVDPKILNVPANDAFLRFISDVRAFTGRSMDYDADTYGFYALMASQLASYLTRLKFIIEMMSEFNPTNSELNDMFAYKLSGTDYASLLNKIPQFKKIYLKYAEKFNSNVVIPSDFSLLQRRVWMADVIIRDSDSMKAPYIYFSNPYAYDFSDDDSELTLLETDWADPSSISSRIEGMMRYLQTDVDNIALVADLRNAASRGMFTPALLPLEFQKHEVIRPNDEVMMQIHNLNTLPGLIYEQGLNAKVLGAIGTNGADLEPVVPFIDHVCVGENVSLSAGAKMATVHTYASGYATNNVEFDFYKDDISSDDVLVATRLKHLGQFGLLDGASTGTADRYSKYFVVTCGTEVVSHIDLVFTDETCSVDDRPLVSTYAFHTSSVDDNIINVKVSLFSTINWHPYVYRLDFGVSAASTDFILRRYGEVENLINVNVVDFNSINEAALLSEFYVIGSVQKV